MLKRAENVSAHHVRGPIGLITGGRYIVVTIGRQPFRAPGKCSREQFWSMVAHSDQYPVRFIAVKERSYWRFDGRWFWDNDGLGAEQVHALLVTRDQRREATISRAQSMVAMGQAPVPTVRGAIPEDVKQLVWTRDQGRCRQCGSNVELQFDHIIPASMGGAATPENLQVLCGPCNRRKGASVSSPQTFAAQAADPTQPPAGWYPDPSGTPRQRYWDGTAWTDHYA